MTKDKDFTSPIYEDDEDFSEEEDEDIDEEID
jgi:hypothetical protein